MAALNENWVYGLRFSSLLWPPPENGHQRQDQTIAYVEYINQLISDRFPEDITQLIQSYYPSKVNRLLDEVLAIFVLHHPEHGHTVIHPILSRVIDGTLAYDKDDPPFSSFISLVGQNNEKEYSEQWAVACGEILRVLTHYNRPIFTYDYQVNELERRSSGSRASTSNSRVGAGIFPLQMDQERKPSRPLTPWITDILLAAPLGIRSDYFRWCGGVMGKYAATEELKPPTTASSGQHPQLMPSTPRWAVANGAGVILSVCDEEVVRYETANLTAAAVPALLLPPPTTPFDEHLVVGLPPLEPYARLFHRYYAIATPSATQRLLLGLLEAPPSWAPDALDASVQLVELLRAAEDYVSDMRLPRNWMHLHFLRAIGTAMSMRAGIAADAAAALLFRILSQPTLLFPPSRHDDGIETPQDPPEDCTSTYHKQMEPHDTEATVEATAQGIASMLCAHGPEVEHRICAIWEAAYGLLPLNSSLVDLPAIVVATPLQPPVLSWNLYLPLLKVLEHVPKGSTSESSLMRIFVATVEAILSRTFPPQISLEISKKPKQHGGSLSTSKNLAVAELRTMVHSLFLEPRVSMNLASHLLYVVLTVCVCREVLPNGKSFGGNNILSQDDISEGHLVINGKAKGERARRKQGPVAAFDSYILAAVCALACELQLFPLAIKNGKCFNTEDLMLVSANLSEASNGFERGITSAIIHTRRFLGILEALFSLNPSSVSTSWSGSSNEMVAAAMVAAHVSELFGRSKACKNALSALMRCSWDTEICSRATSLYHLIDVHGKAVATILDKAGPLEAHLMHVPYLESNSGYQASDESQMKAPKYHDLYKEQTTVVQLTSNGSMGTSTETGNVLTSDGPILESSGQEILDLPLGASDLANFLIKDNLGRFDYTRHNLLKSIIAKEQETCFSVVSLLWHKLLVTPENVGDGRASTQHDWMQIVEALCNVVSVSPKKASAAIVLQAERDLQPWIARDDAHSQLLWRTNQRILKLISKLMNSPEYRDTMIIVASASDLLLRATDGMLVDGEECTLLQLELLKASAKAIQIILDCGESGILLVDGLSNLLKCRLPTTIRCLSHSSMLVRALSTSVLQDIMCSVPMKSYNLSHEATKGTSEPLVLRNISWHADIEQCLKWEAQSRQASGMSTAFLETAARELGFESFHSSFYFDPLGSIPPPH